MEEDNNPFAGSTHLFAGGVSGFEDHLQYNHFNSFNEVSLQKSEDEIEEEEEAEEEEVVANDNEVIYKESPIHIIDTVIHNGTVLYTIQYGYLKIDRRYSEFLSLSKCLSKLLPTAIIPPLPHKHTFTEYLLNPFNAKTDPEIIETRKRLLTNFLKRCMNLEMITSLSIWDKFLDPKVQWIDVLSSPPITLLPNNNLLAPPLDPTKPSPLHLLLPIPQQQHLAQYSIHIDNTFHDKEIKLVNYQKDCNELNKTMKKLNRHFNGLIRDLNQLGAIYNVFSLENDLNKNVSLSIEKIGQSIDNNYLNSEFLAFKYLIEIKEPIIEVKENSKNSIEKVLKFQKLKIVQLNIIKSTIKIREQKINSIKNLQYQSDRLEEVLIKSTSNLNSDSVNETISNLQNGESISKISSPWLKLFHSGNSNDLSKLNSMQRSEEIKKLENELVRLNDCLRIITKDIEEINKSINENLIELLNYFKFKFDLLVKNFVKNILNYLNENLKSWEEAKQAIDDI